MSSQVDRSRDLFFKALTILEFHLAELERTGDWLPLGTEGAFGQLGSFSFNIIAHLTAADGRLSVEEGMLMTELGFEGSYGVQASIINSTLASSPNFLREVPDFLYGAIASDLRFGGTRAGRILAAVYSMCIAVAAADSEGAYEESNLMTEYIEHLRRALHHAGVPDDNDARNALNEEPTLPEQQPTTEFVEDKGKNGAAQSRPLSEVQADLDELVGLTSIKHELHTLVNFIKVRQLRLAQGLRVPDLTLHMVFTGNPGTGKTTVARLLAEVLRDLGILAKGHLVEVDRSGLVGGYVGQTALKVDEVVASALGGVLFIDEAYALVSGREGADYGREALETLLKRMEDHRANLVVIAAGYPERMQEFVNSNPGLRSRFTRFIHFPDYEPEELFTIFERLVRTSDYQLTPEASGIAATQLASHHAMRDEHFGNARLVRNYFERTLAMHSNRLAGQPAATAEALSLILEDDLPTPTKM